MGKKPAERSGKATRESKQMPVRDKAREAMMGYGNSGNNGGYGNQGGGYGQPQQQGFPQQQGYGQGPGYNPAPPVGYAQGQQANYGRGGGAPQAPPVDLDSFALPSMNESPSGGDFRPWPGVEDVFPLEIIQVDGVQEQDRRYWAEKKDPVTKQPMYDQYGQKILIPTYRVPIKFTVIDTPEYRFGGEVIDMNGLTIQVWFNPTMNNESFMYGLMKAILHGKIGPEDKPRLSLLPGARVRGNVFLDKPKIKNGNEVRYPKVTSFLPYQGDLDPSTNQAKFFRGEYSIGPGQQAQTVHSIDDVPF